MPKPIAHVLKDDESLKQFVAAMHDFNQMFCDAIADKVDFTIKLEVRGNLGELLHAKVDAGRWRRPKGVEKRIDQRQRDMAISVNS